MKRDDYTWREAMIDTLYFLLLMAPFLLIADTAPPTPS